MTVTIVSDPGSLKAIHDSLAKVVSPKLLKQIMQASLGVMLSEVKKSTRALLTKDPTGALLRSWEIEFNVGRGRATGGVRSSIPYAKIHDTGGIITPRAGRFLAVPLNLSRSERGLMPRHDPTPMKAWRSKAGKLLLWDVSKAKPTPRYALVPSVQIPATRYLALAVTNAEDQTREAVAATLTRALDEALKKG